MAGPITWEHLRELAGFRAERGCALSLFVSLDPSESPTPKHVSSRINSLLGEAERLLDERKLSMTHEQRTAARADLERVRGWFGDGFERDGARGIAVFADGLDGFWSTLALPCPAGDRVHLDAELYLAPLAPLAASAEDVLVGVVSRERGEVYRLSGAELTEIADETEEVPGQHDQGGWSQARYERHIDELVARHWQRVADTLDRCARRLPGARVVLVGAEDMRSDFESGLSSEARSRLVGWASAESHAGAQQVIECVRPVLDAWYASREDDVLARWREEAATNGRAAAGWEQTLEAASDGRVDVLLVGAGVERAGVERPAYRCPACGRAQAGGGSCPLDGTTLETRPDGLDLAVHQTLAHGGTAQVIRDRLDLEPVGGIGALLRY